ncbi:hypothetical protein [Microbulbifer sp. S227A]|uniref:hypothetical protein n=1 Tax=Microbulbifer sp. S227A TaxID=3415131 RepID=UPI003C7BE606
MTPQHAAIRAALVAHIDQDDQIHADLINTINAHAAEDTVQDHAGLIAILNRHVEETKASHKVLLAALDQHISEEP